MNVLVTGSNGFIGSNITAYFRAMGWRVVGLGRSAQPKTKCDAYIECDLNSDKVSTLFDSIDVKIDAVVHLAADMRREPHNVSVVRDNCTGTQRLLEACESAGIGCYTQLSSLPVIGKPCQTPIMETHPICPPTVYHVTKYTEELLADYANRKHGLRTVSFRISAPVGIGMNPHTIFPTFVRNAVTGKNLILAGQGGRKQTYIHVNDIGQAIAKAIQAEDASGVFNLSSYNYLSNYELAQSCIRVLNSSSKLQFSGVNDPMEDYDWRVSIEKVRREIGFEPEVSIESAIKEYASICK